jgi:hypothetical protein
MYIADTEFDCGAVGRAGEPKVQVFAVFSGFEEEDVVAGVEVCECVESGIVVVG